MNADLQEVVLTLLQGRRYIFSLFHTLFGSLPTAEMVAVASGKDSLRAISLLEEDDDPAPKMLSKTLTLLAHTDLNELIDEYTELFIGPKDFVAAPWESVYTSTERALFQKSSLAVHKWYEQYGCKSIEYPKKPDDHISLMMQFLELLCQRAIEALQAGKMEVYRDALAAQFLFEQNHLLNWIDRYAADMQKSEKRCFYPQFAQTVCSMIHYDNKLLVEIMDSENK